MIKVQFEQTGALAVITLNRPEAGNAIDLDLCRELREAAQRCADSSSIRAVVLEAAGKAFCVGGDLNAFQALGPQRPRVMAELADTFHAAQGLLMTMRAPVIVAVQGAAAGAGLSLAMTGDIVLASDAAHFTVAYTAIGLSADGGSSHLLPRLIGIRRTQELMLTNRRVAAPEALQIGMLTEVVAAADLKSRTRAIAHELAEGPTEAFGVIKRLLAATYDRTFVEQTDVEGAEIARLSARPDAEEGFSAFLSRRRPVFKG